MCSRDDDPTQHDGRQPGNLERYIRAAGSDIRHARSPEDDPHSAFRLTLCGKALPDHRGWSSGPVNANHLIDCPACLSLVPPAEEPMA